MRAAGYPRVSTEEQSSEGHSLEAQEEKIVELIAYEKWTLVGMFTDPGFSGKDLNRPGIKKLIEEIKNQNIDVVVVHKLDRLTRNIGDLYDLLQLFQQHKVQFVSVMERIDTSTAMGRMFVFMLGIFAQWYRENLAEEVRKGMSMRAKKGLHNVTVPMFGYVRDETGNLIIKEDEAKWVRWIFQQYISGVGTTNLAKRLNEMGVRRSQGSMWDQHKVMITLQNLHYIGKIHWKAANAPEEERIIREGYHEAIVPIDVFEEVQHILERKRKGLIPKTSYDYIFSGIVRCGKCGSTYKGKYNKRKQGLCRGYVCSSNVRYGTCKQPGISEDNLAKLLFDSVNFERVEDAAVPLPNEKNEADDIREQLAASEARRSRWQLAYGDGFMPYDDFSKRMKDEMHRVEELEKKLASLSENIVSKISMDEAIETWRNIKENWDKLDQGLRKQVIQALFQKIVIKKEDKWEVESILLA